LLLARASVRSCATQTSTAWLWNFFERRYDENAPTQDAPISRKARAGEVLYVCHQRIKRPRSLSVTDAAVLRS
jgi:hypothetical protein